MPFADQLIGVPTALALTTAIQAVAPHAPLTALREATGILEPFSLRERSDLLRDALLADLPGDYASFAATIRAAASGTVPFSGWLIWPVSTAIAIKGIEAGTDAAFDDALGMLAELTGRLSSEFAIRLLLDHDLSRALPVVLGWTASTDADVRRLATEGTRPFLPWARRVPGILAEPTATLPILHALYRDDDEVVRRSVANHLNDLSRQHPDLAVAATAAWLAEPDEHTARLVVDYVVHHQKANGTLSGKTFKLTTMSLAPGEVVLLAKGHSLRAITTRRYYPGEHAIELQVNGVSSGKTTFTLLPEA